jgi:hypothetical protein
MMHHTHQQNIQIFVKMKKYSDLGGYNNIMPRVEALIMINGVLSDGSLQDQSPDQEPIVVTHPLP